MVRARALMTSTMLAAAFGGAVIVSPARAQDPGAGQAPPPPPQQQQQPTGGTDPSAQPAPQQQPQANPGGREYGQDDPMDTPTVPGTVAKIVDGIAYAPDAAPDAVKQVIWNANRIVGMPYVYGGGHKSFDDSGYDCSGTVSYALHGGGLLLKPKDSSDFMRFGGGGVGQWITIYTNPGHAYMTVAGIRLDTSAADDPSGAKGPAWRPLRQTNRGFKRRHPIGL